MATYSNPFLNGGQVAQSSTNGNGSLLPALPMAPTPGTPAPSGGMRSPFIGPQPAAPARPGPPLPSLLGQGWAPNALSRGAAPGAASGFGGAVPVGRSMRDPNRIAETEARRGRPGMLMNLVMQARQEAEQASRDESAFQRSLQMFGLGQQAQDARAEAAFQQSLQMFGLEQQARDEAFQRGEAAQTARDELRFQQDLERDRIDREAGSITGMETILAPDGSAYLPVARTAGGQVRPMGGATPIKKAPTLDMIPIPGTGTFVPMMGGEPLPGQPAFRMRPGFEKSQSPEYEPVQAPAKEPRIYQGKPDAEGNPGRDYYYQTNPQTGMPMKVYVEDAPEPNANNTIAQTGGGGSWLESMLKKKGGTK